jgi:hypothetical protein
MNVGVAVTVMSTFATIWWVLGTAVAGRGSQLMYAIGLVTSAFLVVLSWRRAGKEFQAPNVRRRRGRVVAIASGVEGVTIFIAVSVLANIGRPDLITPVVAIIVGLHFVPLARWLPAPIYYGTGALLIFIGLAGTAIQEQTARILTVCVGAASALWLSCAFVLLRNRQRD